MTVSEPPAAQKQADFVLFREVPSLVLGDMVVGYPWHYAMSSERPWVAKHLSAMGKICFLAEAIGSELARQVGAPVPEFAIYREGDEIWWLSGLVASTHLPWNPSRADLLENADGVGRALAVDAVVANEDRHNGNLLCVPRNGDESSIHVFTPDFDQACVGLPDEFQKYGTRIVDTTKTAKGLPLDRCVYGAIAAAKHLQSMPFDAVSQIVRTAAILVDERHHKSISLALHARCQQAESLTLGMFDSMEGSK